MNSFFNQNQAQKSPILNNTQQPITLPKQPFTDPPQQPFPLLNMPMQPGGLANDQKVAPQKEVAPYKIRDTKHEADQSFFSAN